MTTYGRAKATAQTYSVPNSPPCQARRLGRATPVSRPAASACCVALMTTSEELDFHLGEDLLEALQRLVHRVGCLHVVLDHVGMRLAPELFGVGLAPGGAVAFIDRQR